MKQQSVRIPTKGGVNLDGVLRKPTGSGPFPAVVFVSGFGMDLHECKNSFDEVSNHLVSLGFTTMQFNFSGIKSTSRIINELPLGERVGELEAVLTYIRNQSFTDPDRIGILAQSFGVPTTFSSDLKHVASLVCVSGVYVLRGLFKDGLQRDRSLKEMRETGRKTEFHDYDGKVVVVDQIFWRNTDAFNPLTKAQQLTIPIMILHGDQDSYTPVEEVRQVYASLPSANKKLKIFKGGDHGITDVPRAMREEFLQELSQWYNYTLQN